MEAPFAQRHYRRNALVIFLDYVAFGLGLALSHPATVLPAFVQQLTPSTLALSLVGVISGGGWQLPQLVAARFLTHRPRMKPYLIGAGLVGRPLWWGLALLLWLGFSQPSWAVLAFFFLVLALFWVTDALAVIAWFDVLAKVIPTERRGRLIGLSQFVSGLMAAGAGVLVGRLLGPDGPPFPRNYAILFALAGLSYMLGLAALAVIREPPGMVDAPMPSWRDYLPLLGRTLRDDALFRQLVLVRLLVGLEQMVIPFYVVYAIEVLGFSQAAVGGFVAAQTLGGVAGSLGLGLVADREGTWRVIQLSGLVSLSAPLVALGLYLGGVRAGDGLSILFVWVFAAIGIVGSALMVGYFNYALEITPPDQRPIYMGLLNALSGTLVLAPLLGGWILTLSSFPTLFGVATFGIAIGLALTPGLREGQQRRTARLGGESY